MNPQEYLFAIVSPLVAHPDNIRIEHLVDDRGVLLTLNLSKEDMGPVIGKNGDTARAIRRLIRQYGMSNKAHVALKINEPHN